MLAACQTSFQALNAALESRTLSLPDLETLLSNARVRGVFGGLFSAAEFKPRAAASGGAIGADNSFKHPVTGAIPFVCLNSHACLCTHVHCGEWWIWGRCAGPPRSCDAPVRLVPLPFPSITPVLH